MKRIISFVPVFFLVSIYTFGQSGYKLDFKIKGWKDTTVYLGHYFGESTYAKDTAKVNSAGEFSFEGKTPLGQGIYFLILNKTRMLDMVIGADQTFSMETDAADMVKNMVVKGDEDNKLFFDNMLYYSERNKEGEPIFKILKDSLLSDEKKKEARAAFAKLNDKVVAHQNELIAKYPKTMTARWMMATKPITIPDPPKKADGTIDSMFQYKYYRAHYFDNFNLADDAMLRLPRPVYQEKIKEYLSKLIVPHPDSITKAIDWMVSKAKRNPDTYQYLVRTCLFDYQNPSIMGLEGVFVKLYDNYFATGEMDYWLSDKGKKDIKEHAARLRLAQIGSIAPNLIMQDKNLQPKSMYDIKAKYTVLLFLNPDCGHCKEETPKLVSFYNANKAKYNFEVFAVMSDTSLLKMRNFISDMQMPWITVNGPRTYSKQHFTELYQADTTPFMYVIDDKKKIIARKLPIESLEEFLTKHERFLKLQKESSPKGAGK